QLEDEFSKWRTGCVELCPSVLVVPEEHAGGRVHIERPTEAPSPFNRNRIRHALIVGRWLWSLASGFQRVVLRFTRCSSRGWGDPKIRGLVVGATEKLRWTFVGPQGK